MVGRLFTLLHREIRGLHEAAYLLGVFAILSQILALIRDRLLAAHFGAGATLDTYYAAFRLPDFIFVSVASLVSLYVLIPFLSEIPEGQGEKQRAFLSRIVSFFTFLIIGASAIAFLLAPVLLRALFPGFDATHFNELVLLTRILLLQPIFLGLSNIAASVTQLHGRFVLYAITPLFYNLGIIAGVLWLYPIFGIMGLGMGVVLGAMLHLGIQIPFIVRHKVFPRLTLSFNGTELRRLLALSIPRTIALSANQIALLALTGFASLQASGAITTFNFSFNLQSVPLSIIGISYSVAAFPTLARLFSSGVHQEFLAHITAAARHIIFWSTPAMVLCIVLRAQIVRVVLGSGQFNWEDTRLTAAALALFAISIVAQGLVLLFVRGFYAAGNTRTPLIVNSICSMLVIAFGFLFLNIFSTVPTFRFFMESLLRVEDLPRTGMLMLPLAYSLAAIVNVLALWTLFRRHFKGFQMQIARSFLESFATSMVMGFVAYECLTIFGRIFDLNQFLGIFAQGFFSGLLGIIAGTTLLWVLGNAEAREVKSALHKKFWKSRTLAAETPDPSTLIS